MFSGFMSCNLTKRFRPAKGVLIMLAVILMFFALTSSALAEGKTPGQNEWQFDEGDAGGDLIDKLYISGPMVGIKHWF